jgi:hypothetical protein
MQSNPQTCQEVKKRVKMATKGHEHGWRKGHKQKNKAEMDLELIEIRARMEKLTLNM